LAISRFKREVIEDVVLLRGYKPTPYLEEVHVKTIVRDPAIGYKEGPAKQSGASA